MKLVILSPFIGAFSFYVFSWLVGLPNEPIPPWPVLLVAGAMSLYLLCVIHVMQR